MKNQVFVGEKQYLLDLLKLHNSYLFFTNPNLDEFEEIISANLHNKLIIIFYDGDFTIDRAKIARNCPEDCILLLENGKFKIDFSHIILNAEKLTEIIAKKLNITNPPKIINDIFNNLYQYEILGHYPKQIIDFDLMDPIKFFRSKLYGLSYEKSEERKSLFKSILYRLEYSFKLTGLHGLPAYYMLMQKIIS